MDLMVLKNNNSGILSIILKFHSLVSCDRNPDGKCLVNDRYVLFGKVHNVSRGFPFPSV